MAWLFVIVSSFLVATLLTHVVAAAVSNDWSDFYFTISGARFPKTHLQMWSCIVIVLAIAVIGFVFENFTIAAALLFTAVGLPYAFFQWQVIARKLRLFWRR